MNGEGWADEPAYMDFEEPEAPESGKKPEKDKPIAPLFPVVHLPAAAPAEKSMQVVRGVSLRAKACVNMRLEGASFVEIAEYLEYESPAAAKRDCERALAATHPVEDWDTMRHMMVARAEKLFSNSLKHAQADYYVTEEGDKVANTEKRAWHAQAASDLTNLANISGAKAPTKMEITPGEVEMERLVEEILSRSGHEVAVEADVLELSVLPREEDADEVDTYGE